MGQRKGRKGRDQRSRGRNSVEDGSVGVKLGSAEFH